jgi:putative transposase
MSRAKLKSHYHCVFDLNYHLVLVTKFRRKCFNDEILTRLEAIFSSLCEQWSIDLVEFNGEDDHVHLLLNLHPNVAPSTLINNLKTVSSRLLRKEFPAHFKQFYWSNPGIWTRAYCLISVGGAPLEVLRKYIEDQDRPKS